MIVRHPESLTNLSCIDSVVLSLDGVLTSGDYKIMAVSSLSKNYFVDGSFEDTVEASKGLISSSDSAVFGQSGNPKDSIDLNQLRGFLTTKEILKGEEMAILRFLRYKFDQDSKFYNGYKEQIELKEGSKGIKDSQIEQYSEKSQEFEKELDGDFIE